MQVGLRLITILTVIVLIGTLPVLALDPSLDVSQYAHTAWTIRDGFSLGNIYFMAQTPDGYLWLGSEFGFFRFDGVHAVPWQPSAGQQLPNKPYAPFITRDGTLWFGLGTSLASWSGGKLTRYPELEGLGVESLIEDREGTVWMGAWGNSDSPARLCGIRNGRVQCYGEDGTFGKSVGALYEDSSGTLWAAASSGIWRWKPGPPRRYPTRAKNVTALSEGGDGRLLIAEYGSGLMQVVADKVESYSIRSPNNPNRLLAGRDVNSNRLLRDRDGGLWIATVERGLIHVHDGRTDVLTKADGLSGDVVLRLFEDHEGNIWVSTTGGLDRFRELPVTTISTRQGLSSDATHSVLAAADGSVWAGTHDGLTRFKNGQITILRKEGGLPGSATQSLFQDDRGRIWGSFTNHGLAYFKDDRFVAVPGQPSEEVFSITGDKSGNLWLSRNRGLSHFLEGRLVEHFAWAVLGRHQQATAVLFDPERGGVWLSFWTDGGVLYFKDGQVRASYTPADGLGKGHVPALRLDPDGALWAATEEGGLSRIKDGRVATLTTRNGLPCDTIHWSIEGDDLSLWMYTACGLVRIARADLEAWIADPNRRVDTRVWGAADGVKLRSNAASGFSPTVAKASDGRLWYLTGEGIQVVDPRHLSSNKLPPPVHIEQVIVNDKPYWQNSPGAVVSRLRLPARIRDLTIDYTALSFAAPEKIHFKYKLEGQDSDWREVVNDREVQYSNLGPHTYRFRVVAANNSGVWNDQGDTLEFSVLPAYYQTNWFRALCATAFLVLLWGAHRYRVQRLHHDFEMTLEARIGERTRIARDLHDTLLQSFHGLLLRFQTVFLLLPERPVEAKEKLESAIEQAAGAITEGRDAVQGLRASTIERNDLALAISTLGEELENESSNHRPTTFRVAVEGQASDLHPILRDEIYKIAAEALRNAFHHAQAKQVEVEVRYDDDQFRLRVRDDGKGIDATFLSSHGREGHHGLRGMRERATLIKGKLAVWSEVDAGTEVELRVPASAAYTRDHKRSWLSRKFSGKAKT
jgi:signal transduction histidine kinase/ligand-binding sensor domain-containing protein